MSSVRTLAGFALVVALALAPASPAHAGGSSGGGGSKEKRITSAESYVPVNGLTTSVMQDFAPAGMLIVDFGLDIPDPTLRSRAQRLAPRIRDAGRAALAEYAFAHQRVNDAPDPQQVKRLIQRNIDQALGQPGAQVLLSNIMVQARR